MKKYQLAWISTPPAVDLQLGSTDPDLVSWFLEQLKEFSPEFQYVENMINRSFDLDGNQTFCIVNTMDGRDTQINYWLLQQLLQTGWEPFAVSAHGDSIYSDFFYLRREVSREE